MKKVTVLFVLLACFFIFCSSGNVDYLDDDETTSSLIWTEVGSAWGPDFLNDWGDYTAGDYENCMYAIDNDGMLHIVGMIESSSSVTVPSSIFILPKGYRPATQQSALIEASDGSVIPPETLRNLTIYTDGTVEANGLDSENTISFGHILVKLD